jgi:hypothetical protein
MACLYGGFKQAFDWYPPRPIREEQVEYLPWVMHERGKLFDQETFNVPNPSKGRKMP